ncbi:transcription antitermination protein NusB [Mesomycoplasma ovipneumoniae]|uniref:Transcription antitermination protein NusB n=1 Tax=Mesomycoplasma ovipneumoniae TaxID=29562 RepID=A0AAJ2UE99_9BACT|nr:transcription antitermination protein NusB [Mesomycoplasma ovipneumoniae]MDW2906017.1 transcription antitermination protein NusB [Mesomycoplasma ovipneumoniae]MDW2914022.1 transcription antitermination protein NusB [Mesomycoplasma ovipneumoniae]
MNHLNKKYSPKNQKYRNKKKNTHPYFDQETKEFAHVLQKQRSLFESSLECNITKNLLGNSSQNDTQGSLKNLDNLRNQSCQHNSNLMKITYENRAFCSNSESINYQNKHVKNSEDDEENSCLEFQSLSKQRIKRMANISIIYGSQLFDKNIDIDEIKNKYFEVTFDQLKILTFVKKNYVFLKKVITLQLKSNWSWDRILPLIRSILLLGAAELFFQPRRIIFNEAIEITKIFSIEGGDEFSFVNAVLQKVYNYYENKNLLRPQK